jgi:O6-methylguanine-DNA--protein-cysteine methyltransferase
MPKPENIVKHKFKPGQSGNKKGRPKGVRNISTVLKEYLNTEIEIEHPVTRELIKGNAIELMVLAQIRNAIFGDVKAFNAIADRTEGKAVQTVVNTPEQNTLTVHVEGGLSALKKK